MNKNNQMVIEVRIVVYPREGWMELIGKDHEESYEVLEIFNILI